MLEEKLGLILKGRWGKLSSTEIDAEMLSEIADEMIVELKNKKYDSLSNVPFKDLLLWKAGWKIKTAKEILNFVKEQDDLDLVEKWIEEKYLKKPGSKDAGN